MLKRLFALMIPANVSYVQWRRNCKFFVVLGGLLVALIDLGPDVWANGLGWGEVLRCVFLFGVVSGMLLLAFLSARELSLSLGRRMVGCLEEAHRAGTAPAFPNQGWDVFEQGRDATIRLLELRDEKIALLSRELEFYRPLAEDMPGLEVFFGVDGRLAWVNPAVQVLTGFSAAECIDAGDPTELWVYIKDRASMREMLAGAMQGVAHDGCELRIQHRDGRVLWYACRWYPLRDAVGRVIGTRFSAQDVQARKDAELKLLENVAALRRAQALKEHYLNRSNEERLRLGALLEILDVGILFVDRDRRVVYMNQRCADMWGLGDRAEVVGVRDEILLAKTGLLRVDNEAYLQHVEDTVGKRSASAEYDIYCSDGRVVRERSSLVSAEDGERAIGRVWIYEDITERLQTQARLIELAERDPLTGLYNRRRFHEDLQRLMAETMRNKESLGLLCFDLDDFKQVNDELGHQAGDALLKALADELCGVIRRNELLFRLGGDEFAILVPRPTPECLAHLARRVMLRAEALGFEFDGQAASVSISLGMAISPLHAHDADSLVLAADRALFQAKADGRHCWRMAYRWTAEEPAPNLISNAPETLQ